jgi:hypothetical protein
MKYINRQGIVIHAMEWDGSKRSMDEIGKTFGIKINYDVTEPKAFRAIVDDESVFELSPSVAANSTFFTSPVSGEFTYMPTVAFDKLFKPISDERVLIVEELKKDMLLKLRECQKDGKPDDWRKLGLSVLYQRLLAEDYELQCELRKIELGDAAADFDAARRECADVANCAAMVHDAINGMELEVMHKRKGKNEA